MPLSLYEPRLVRVGENDVSTQADVAHLIVKLPYQAAVALSAQMETTPDEMINGAFAIIDAAVKAGVDDE